MCTCKHVYNLYLFIPVTCMCLNQVCAAYLTLTQHFIFPISLCKNQGHLHGIL